MQDHEKAGDHFGTRVGAKHTAYPEWGISPSRGMMWVVWRITISPTEHLGGSAVVKPESLKIIYVVLLHSE